MCWPWEGQIIVGGGVLGVNYWPPGSFDPVSMSVGRLMGPPAGARPSSRGVWFLVWAQLTEPDEVMGAVNGYRLGISLLDSPSDPVSLIGT